MSWLSSSPQRLPSAVHSNLRTVLQSVTPIVPGRSLPDQSGANSKGTKGYFILSELWESYYEWSACGVGCPILLKNGDRVNQYYCPYLSGIQLFPRKSPPTARNTRVNKHHAELETESLSDDSESDKSSKLSNNSGKTWDVASGDSSIDLEGLTSNQESHAELYLEFYDRCSPYFRVPLMEKVVGFAKKYPGIMTFKSTDLYAASWMAIAWYPIYHIPFKRTIKDLSACFLTFHTLSSCYQEILNDNQDDSETRIGGYKVKARGNKKGRIQIVLPPFALATYKLQGELWQNPFTADEAAFNHLHRAAYSWLKQLNVQHHDFNFFALHSYYGMGRGVGMGMYV